MIALEQLKTLETKTLSCLSVDKEKGASGKWSILFAEKTHFQKKNELTFHIHEIENDIFIEFRVKDPLQWSVKQALHLCKQLIVLIKEDKKQRLKFLVQKRKIHIINFHSEDPIDGSKGVNFQRFQRSIDAWDENCKQGTLVYPHYHNVVMLYGKQSKKIAGSLEKVAGVYCVKKKRDRYLIAFPHKTYVEESIAVQEMVRVLRESGMLAYSFYDGRYDFEDKGFVDPDYLEFTSGRQALLYIGATMGFAVLFLLFYPIYWMFEQTKKIKTHTKAKKSGKP